MEMYKDQQADAGKVKSSLGFYGSPVGLETRDQKKTEQYQRTSRQTYNGSVTLYGNAASNLSVRGKPDTVVSYGYDKPGSNSAIYDRYSKSGFEKPIVSQTQLPTMSPAPLTSEKYS